MKQRIEETRAEQAREVFAHWRKLFSRPNARLDGKRMGKICQRLKDGWTVEELKRALDGYTHSQFHNGVNERRKKYLELGLLLRDAEHVERGLELAENPASGKEVTKADANRANQSEIFEERMGSQFFSPTPIGGGNGNKKLLGS